MEKEQQALVKDMAYFGLLALFAPSAMRYADTGVELYLLPVVNKSNNNGKFGFGRLELTIYCVDYKRLAN